MATILIVEDDVEILEMMKIALRRKGHEVYGSPNGVDALYQVSYYKPDLVILDLMMPWASGDAVLGYIRSTTSVKQTRVLVVSAHPNGAELAQQLEADGYVGKPVEMNVLTGYVERLLEPSNS
ncbi:MAG: response regulator transcription factor [Chloroflexi bacterium]|nr:response regulator transcription factor [Chloroflexota bacterium]